MEYTVNEYTDAQARARISLHVDRMALGFFGDSEPIGGGLSELRIHYGPGYRVYYGREADKVYLLLCGGDKSTQPGDIEKAKAHWREHNKRRQQDGT